MVTEGLAWRLTAFGDPRTGVRQEKLRYADPMAGEVLVRARTAGAGYPDAMMAAGAFPLLGEPPFGLGEEVCGDVVAVGPGSRFTVGDRILGITAFLRGWGGYAEYAYVREGSAIPVPAPLTDEEAGGFPIAYRTAYAGLVERGGLTAGEQLVVLGGAGSSGVAAIQLGKALGATVTAVAGSPEKVAFCRSIGADHAVSHRDQDLAKELRGATGGGADLVFDVVGGETAGTAVRALARHGRIAIVGFASGAPVALDPVDMLLRNYTAVGVLADAHSPAGEEAAWGRLAELAEQGLLRTPVGKVWSFDQVPDMIAEQTTPPPGKIVVKIAG
ncbi:quinone oxidoreductase family protein [Asanoa siamensis]|uniref:NAD(P)H quinone oxidoreductase n=1 Tax=Asanoa siamensis TaxID=926357 RepID=A0ABQ4CR47_9ACTN|nr:NADPH:quinone oxidoreductase family protein [Asanoa siamensis]GIF73737.1 NAD(P)H quinone oxidoreductase [Asanoa siamensis]